jgi:signal transduction histidine kinase
LIRKLFPPAPPGPREPFAWLRFLHQPLAALGLLAIDPSAWPLYVSVLIVLTLEWPFHIQLVEDMEIYPSAEWTSAAAAYVLGAAILPIFWLSATIGFFLIFVLDSAGLVRADGIAADTVRAIRGQPSPPAVGVDGHLRGFVNVSTHAVRVLTVGALRAVAPSAPLFLLVLLTEGMVATWLAVVPIPGRMAPRRRWRALATALGQDILVATAALQVLMVYFLLVTYERGGMAAFVGASVCTLFLHGILKRLNDARVESERQRRRVVRMQEELDRGHRLAVIGGTASAVFHQIARQHGAIGMLAHLLVREAKADGGGSPDIVHQHASGILTSVEEANRVIDELLRFGQDRALNLYTQSLRALIDACIEDCRPRADERGVRLEVLQGPDQDVLVDKHKIKQALGNVLDNAIEASVAGGRIEVRPSLEGRLARVAVRDYGAGVPERVRSRLFTPFCTTKSRGVGLGLALARELVQAHGGEVTWLPAEPGAVFVLTLPLEPAPVV